MVVCTHYYNSHVSYSAVMRENQFRRFVITEHCVSVCLDGSIKNMFTTMRTSPRDSTSLSIHAAKGVSYLRTWMMCAHNPDTIYVQNYVCKLS